MTSVLRRLNLDHTILSNAVSFFGSAVATSGLGFAYSWLGTNLFDKATFGLATAAVAAMMLLSGLGLLGLTTLLVGELPRVRQRAPALLMAALIVSAVAGAVLGVLFALAAPLVSDELGALLSGVPAVVLFTLGVVLATVTQVFDYAMVGLLRSGLQLWRNILSSAVKVIAIGAAAVLDGPAQVLALVIYSTWTLGHLASLAVLALRLKRRGERVLHRPDWPLMHSLRGSALKHHLLNIAWQSPVWIFPLIVTALLGTSYNGSFYVAWMIFFIAFKIPESLTTVLYAVNAADQALLAQKTRFTLRTSLALTLLAAIVLIPAAPFVLRLFGEAYAQEATGALRLLMLSVFPLIVKQHFLAIMQTTRQIGRATFYMYGGAVLEITLASLGLLWATGNGWDGLTGLALGILIAQCVEAVVMARTVYATAKHGAPTALADASRAPFTD